MAQRFTAHPATSCLITGEKVLGTKEKIKSSQDLEIKRLSEECQKIKCQMINCVSIKKKAQLKNERKYFKKEMNRKLKKKEEQELDRKMEHLEKITDDNTRYHYVMREINKPKQKIPILVKDAEGNVPGSTSEKIKIIEEYFKRTLAPANMTEEFLSIPPCAMTTKFTSQEIKTIAKS